MDSATRAAWVAAVAAVIAVGLSIRTEFLRGDEELTVTAEPFHGDYSTQLVAVPERNTGAIGIHWTILVSNNGETVASLVKHNVVEVQRAGDLVRYRALDQGLHTVSFAPLELPLTIEAGHAKRFNIRIGTLLDPIAFVIARRKWATEVESIRKFAVYMAAQDLGPHKMESVWSYIPKKNVLFIPGMRREQRFLLTFTTGRNKRAQTSLGAGGLAIPVEDP